METTERPVAESIWGKFPSGDDCRIPILVVAGGKATGKTSLVSMIDPERTVMIDLEDSSETYSFPYMHRFSLFEELASSGKEPTPLAVFEFVKDLLESDKFPKATVLAIDPASDFSQGLFDYIVANSEKFGISSGQVDKMTGIIWGKAKSFLKTMLGVASKRHGIQTVAITLHIGKAWVDGRPSRQEKAKGVDTFYELASLFLWLTKDDSNQQLPDGISVPPFGKSRISIPQKDEGGNWSMVSCFPPKMEKCTVANLRHYIANPPNWSKLKKAEKVFPKEATEAEKLELQVEVAEKQAEAEGLRLERLNRVEDAAKRQHAAESAAVNQQAVADATKPMQDPQPTTEPERNGQVTDQPSHPQTDKALSPITAEQLYTLGGLYKEVAPTAEQWNKVLSKYGVASAQKLDQGDAEQLIVYMTGFLEKKRGESDRDQWAKQVLSTAK